jgi:hypothetical protein
LVTQIRPAPTVIPLGFEPTGALAVTSPLLGSFERRVLGEDRGLEASQLLPRLQPELRHESAPGASVGGQRLHLSARAKEREHVLRDQPLAVRVAGDELFELRHEGHMASERQLGVGAVLDRL